MKDSEPSVSFLDPIHKKCKQIEDAIVPLKKRIGRLEATIFILFGIIVAMGYVQHKQNQLLKLVAIGTAEALASAAEQTIKNAEQDALIKQFRGVDHKTRIERVYGTALKIGY